MEKTNQAKTITIYDIAKEAGVSASTVSRVLTGSASVRQEKKERIQGLIDKYGFKPNALAKGLSDTSTKTIGIIVADVRNPYYSSLFVACELAAERAGYHVSMSNSLGTKDREQAQLDMMQQQRADAIIQMGGRVDDLVSDESYSEKVRNLCSTTPVVVTGKLDKAPVYSVIIDEAESMRLIMEHLHGLGHRKIALVGGDLAVTSTFYKYRCYQEMLQKYEIRENGEYVVNGSYDPETGYIAMNRILKLKDRPTAVIAINDFAAAGAIRAMREHNLQIPEDISIVSFDNTYIAELTRPELTSIDYDYAAFGEKLVNTAIAAATGQKPAERQIMKPTLVIRESTGPCRE